MTRVLFTGFEPFGGDSFNASAAAVQQAAERELPGVELRTALLPVAFQQAPYELLRAIEDTQPDAVICVGEAGKRSSISIERCARNEATARIPDNLGWQPIGEKLDDGPHELPTRLNVPAILAALETAGLAAEPSDDAGLFVCNATFRAVLTGYAGPAGFVHVPALRPTGKALVGAETDPTKTAAVTSTLTLDDLAEALRIVAAVTAHCVT